MRLGAMTILFREQLGTDKHISYTESLERIKNTGFEVADINLCQICGHKTELHRDDWKAEADRIATTIEKCGLDIPQCHLPFKSSKVKWKTPEDYAYYEQMFFRAIDVASYLSIPWGVVHIEKFRKPDLSHEERVKKNAEYYSPFIEYALKKGVGVAFENQPLGKEHDVGYLAEHVCEVVDYFGDGRIGACWDTGHANTVYADQFEPLKLLGERLKCTHIDDNRGTEDLHLAPFGGKIKWKSVMDGLREIDYKGDLILEVSTNYFTPNAIKDIAARYAYESAKLLLEL